MIARTDRLYDTFDNLPRENVRRQLEAWDEDQGRAMRAAENVLRKPIRKCPWSPALRNAGIVREYWKLRLRDCLQSTDHTARILRLESQVQQYDPSFCLPQQDKAFSLAPIRLRFNRSTKEFRKIQKIPPARIDRKHCMISFRITTPASY